MRYPASEKGEIIELVEQSHLPAKRTLDKLGIPRATFFTDGMIAIVTAALRRWLTTGPDRTASGTASRTMCEGRSSTWHWSFQSCHRASWRCALQTRESILSQRLRCIAC